MFHVAGSDFRIFCDYDARELRVQVNASASLLGFLPMWHEVAVFKTIEEWEKSRFSKEVTSEAVEEMITWFWIDLATK